MQERDRFRGRRADLEFAAHSAAEHGDRLPIVLQPEGMADHRRGVQYTGREHLHGTAEGVGDRHRTDHADLVVVDRKRRERRARVGRRDSELQEGPAPAYPSQAVLDGRNRARAVDHHVPAIRTAYRVGRVHGQLQPDLACRDQPGWVVVDDGHRRRAGAGRELGHDQPHGARPVDQIVLAQPPRQQVVAVDGTSQRLDQRGELQVDRIGKLVHVRGGRDDEVRGRAVGPRYASAVPVVAQVGPAGGAVAAVAAIEGGIDGDPVAGRHVADLVPDLVHDARRLVAGHDGVDRGRELTVEHVQIRAAQADGLDADDNFPRTGIGIRPLDQLVRAWPREDDGPHSRRVTH